MRDIEYFYVNVGGGVEVPCKRSKEEMKRIYKKVFDEQDRFIAEVQELMKRRYRGPLFRLIEALRFYDDVIEFRELARRGHQKAAGGRALERG